MSSKKSRNNRRNNRRNFNEGAGPIVGIGVTRGAMHAMGYGDDVERATADTQHTVDVHQRNLQRMAKKHSIGTGMVFLEMHHPQRSTECLRVMLKAQGPSRCLFQFDTCDVDADLKDFPATHLWQVAGMPDRIFFGPERPHASAA